MPSQTIHISSWYINIHSLNKTTFFIRVYHEDGGRGVDPGGSSRPNENIRGKTYRFAPSPNNFDNLKTFIINNARIGLKRTVRPYKTSNLP